MKKMHWIALALTFAILTGCGSTSEELTQNNQDIEQPAANQGTLEIDMQLFTPAAQMAAVAVKAGGGYVPTELDLRQKIDYVDFYVTNQFYTIYIDTITVIDGRLTGMLNIEEGDYQLEAICRTVGGVELYSDNQKIAITSGQTSEITLVFKKKSPIWIAHKINNLPNAFGADQNYNFDTKNSYSGGVWVDQQRVLNISFPYETFENEVFHILLYDNNGVIHSIDVTTNLFADLEESNLKGYTEQTWPTPGTISIEAIFEADGGFVQALFASQSAQPHRYLDNVVLNFSNFTNVGAKDAIITEVTYDVWDATTISNFSLHIYDTQIGACEVISRTEYGQAVVKCYPNHILPASAMATFQLRGDIGNYSADQWLSIGISGAKVTDADGNTIPFSGTSGTMSVEVQ